MPAKVQKAGLHTCALFVKSCPARPYTSPGACLRGRGRRRVPCRGLALHIVNYILTMLPRQHFVRLVKQFYFTSTATTIVCTYSTYTNYSLQLQTIIYIIYARGHTRFCAYNVSARIIYYIGIPKHIFLAYYRYILYFLHFSIFAHRVQLYDIPSIIAYIATIIHILATFSIFTIRLKRRILWAQQNNSTTVTTKSMFCCMFQNGAAIRLTVVTKYTTYFVVH